MESRHTRRLVRYWVFLSIAFLLGLFFYFYYGVLHTLFSSISASVGMIGPRYLMAAIGLYYITGFVLAIVFLGFDVRARDVRDSIVEVLDSRPLTNLELVIGRFISLFMSAFIPIIALVILIEVLGWVLPLLGSAVGRTVEPLSLVAFTLLMAVPAIAFTIALVFVITLLVRNRLLAALLSIAAIVGLYWATFALSSAYSPAVDFVGSGQVAFPSDIVPGLSARGGWLQRIGVLLIGLGLVGIAAVIHPRLDGDDRWRPTAVSGVLIAIGVSFLLIMTGQRLGLVQEIDQWRAAHEARAGEPIPDILSIEGDVTIAPGRRLDADLDLELQAPPGQALDHVLLTLNPGLEVDGVTGADGRALTAEQADGLLDITLDRPLSPGERTSLNLRYGGLPNTRFGYLDSTVNIEDISMAQAQIGILGYERGIFDSRYVALMPGIRWLPASGVDVGRDDPRKRPVDYYRVALDVDVPAGWLVGGPGKRQVVSSGSDETTFRFAPGPAVPEVALMASRFESFSTEIDGVTFEVLVDPDHDQNFDVLADARDEIEQWVADHLEVARDAGLAYPFDAFTLVEVPNTLRSFEGGWRLDTALAPPGMMLLRETSFPTARFDFDFFDSSFFGNSRDYDQEGGKPRIERNRLIGFFSNDFSGGNLFTGAARSFFAHRTSAYGPEAIALDFALDELATLLISGQRSYFSVHMFTNINSAATNIIAGVQGRQGITSVTDAMIQVQTSQTDVWESALDSTLADLDPYADPQRTIDVLTLKGGQMAQAIYDTLGPEAVGELLAKLLENHAGGSFTLDDLVAAGSSVSDGLGALFDDWFAGTGLPGFVAESAELYRLPDNESGDSRYQLLVRVRNDERVTGFTRIAWVIGGRGLNAPSGNDANNGQQSVQAVQAVASGARATSDPIRIPGRSTIEFGVVLSEPPAAAYVHPYLSLNRENFLAGTFNTGQIPNRNAEPLNGVRVLPFETPPDDRIIVDDLDDGFSIVADEGAGDLRLGGRETATAGTDRGLPVATGNTVPTRWSRRNVQSSWGHYRHTLAYMGPGDGTTRAILKASIPSAGVWELELYQPFLQYVAPENRGTWNLEIVSGNGRESVGYDATVGATGWNLVGEYELPAGDVSVEISDATDGQLIVADAIAWSPVRVRGQASAAARGETPASTDGRTATDTDEPDSR